MIAFDNRSNLQDYVDINSSNDFIISDCEDSRMLRQSYENRDFSNVIWIMGNTAIHHIYMHKKEFFYVESLINHINNVIKSITFYNDTPSVKTEFILSFGPTYRNYVLRFINHRILFHEHLASILGLTMEKNNPNATTVKCISKRCY